MPVTTIERPAAVSTTTNALRHLIETRRAEKRLSYGDIARAGGLPKSTVHKLATTVRWTKAPHPETLDRLALGLGVSASVVRRAAAEASGLTAVHTVEETDEGLRVLIGSIEELTPDQRAQVAALVDAMRSHG